MTEQKLTLRPEPLNLRECVADIVGLLSPKRPEKDSWCSLSWQTTGAAPRILIVEDDPTNRALLQLALSNQHYETETVGDGLQALERWENVVYDLIIMDMQIPKMNGGEERGDSLM